MELKTLGYVQRKFPALCSLKGITLSQGKSKRIRVQARLALKVQDVSGKTPCFLMVFPDGSVSIHRAD